MSFLDRFPAIALSTLVVSGCLWGMWNSLKLTRTDFLFRQDTADSLRSVILLEPDDSDAYSRLAQLDETHSTELLETALSLNRYNAQAAIELGLRYEADGDYSRAEKFLLQAFSVDRTYRPRWSLANYYLRRDNIPAFWTWARQAAEMPSDDMGALFELCWRVSPDPQQITANILSDNPELVRQYLRFLIGRGSMRIADSVAPRLVRVGNPETDGPLLLSIVNGLVAADDAPGANALWKTLIGQHWVLADAMLPNNPNFARPPLPTNFDWELSSYPGLHSWTGTSGLETEFTGAQPENCSIAEQILVLMPGRYTMNYSYRTVDIAPDTGIQWQVIDVKSGAVLANSYGLSSDALTHGAMEFSVGRDTSMMRLRLTYQRAIGTPRISGTLVIVSTGIASHL